MKVIILSGIPGSGKTSLALSKFVNYYRISQDDLGSRKACEKKFREIAELNKDIIIDRCNHTRKQRLTWIKLAQKYKATSIDCIYLNIYEQEAINRITIRKNHPTINNLSIEKMKNIVYNFSNEIEIPSIHENFNSVLHIRSY